MGIPIKSPQDYYNEIINSLSINADNGVATYPNSPVYDIFIKPLGDSLFDINILSEFIYASRSLIELQRIVLDNDFRNKLQYALNITKDETDTLISGAIDNLANNWNEVRKQASKAKGFVRLYFNTSTIGALSQLTINTDTNLEFITTNTFTSDVMLSFDNVRNLYFLDVSIEASQTGSQYNVEAGTINIISANITGLVSVTNPYRTVYGRDIETDLEFIERIKTSWRSRKQSTLGGLIDTITSYPNVIDASVIMPGTDLSVRLEKNAVDVYIMNSPVYEQTNRIYNILSSVYAYETINSELSYEMYPIPYYQDEWKFKLLDCPVNSVVKVEAGDGSTFGTVVSSNDYTFTADTTSNYAGSVKAHDVISIKRSAFTTESHIKITYDYDKQFYDMQNLNNNLNYAIIGADILYKKALPKYVDVNVSVLQLQGYNLTSVKAVINSDLAIFFNGGTDSNGIQRLAQKLGGYIDASDILDVILSVEGVDRVDLTTFSLVIDGDTITGRYTTPYNTYMQLGTITYTDYPL